MINEKNWMEHKRKNLHGIADPSYKKHIIDSMRSWVDDPYRNPKEEVLQIATMKRLLLDPLEKWLSGKKKDTVATEAAVNFSQVIRDILLEFEYYGEFLNLFNLQKLDDAWATFLLIYVDGGGLELSEKQSVKAKKQREKVIHNIICRAYRQLPEGTAKEIWPGLLPLLEDKFCDDLVKSHGNKRQPLTWKYEYSDKSKQKFLSFKTFQNKLTKIKKETKI